MVESYPRAAVDSLIAECGMWAIGDDYELGHAIEAAGPEALRALVSAVGALPDGVWDWLADPESSSPRPSDEYIAVSEITFAADLARVTLDQLNQHY